MTEPGRIEATWCAFPAPAETLPVSFNLEAPSDWIDQWFGTARSFWFRPANGRAIAFVLRGAPSVDEWVTDVTARPGYVASDPAPITIGGAPGYVFDLSLAPDAASADVPALFEDPEQSWRLQEGSRVRMWIVDLAGEPLAIVTGAPDQDFEVWAGAVGEALATLSWEPYR